MAGHGDKEQLLKNDSEEVTPTVQLSPGHRRLRSLSGESYGGRQSTEKPIFSFENVETGHTVTVKQDSPVDSYHSSHASLASAVRRSSNLSVGVHDMLAVPSPQVTGRLRSITRAYPGGTLQQYPGSYRSSRIDWSREVVTSGIVISVLPDGMQASGLDERLLRGTKTKVLVSESVCCDDV
ncbi:PREDICTED: uncharacterized protein LOC106821654 [Priapulus caudatus]|uniref:Uncharacterized protein LOC106821654 n=1 Tax=Priapulus caudatus TaxID=37621 RepID=A0ABM1FC59_PRICU|nr:PREDICTED: uncharacterized protein LOC106821654 [Priapulus caudatus]